MGNPPGLQRPSVLSNDLKERGLKGEKHSVSLYFSDFGTSNCEFTCNCWYMLPPVNRMLYSIPMAYFINIRTIQCLAKSKNQGLYSASLVSFQNGLNCRGKTCEVQYHSNKINNVLSPTGSLWCRRSQQSFNTSTHFLFSFLLTTCFGPYRPSSEPVGQMRNRMQHPKVKKKYSRFETTIYVAPMLNLSRIKYLHAIILYVIILRCLTTCCRLVSWSANFLFWIWRWYVPETSATFTTTTARTSNPT
jgi:hypothetical protein